MDLREIETSVRSALADHFPPYEPTHRVEVSLDRGCIVHIGYRAEDTVWPRGTTHFDAILNGNILKVLHVESKGSETIAMLEAIDEIGKRLGCLDVENLAQVRRHTDGSKRPVEQGRQDDPEKPQRPQSRLFE